MKMRLFLLAVFISTQVLAQDFASTLKKAQEGDAAAQFDIGTMYDVGEGVHRNWKKAAEWYRKAAEQGEVAAQYNLAIMYDSGEGVEKDIVKAYAWMATAEMFGYHGARESSKDFYKRMNKKEQDKGEALVAEIVNRITSRNKNFTAPAPVDTGKP